MLASYKREDTDAAGAGWSYGGARGRGWRTKVLLYTVFLLVVMASTYVLLRQYEVIQAEDEGPYAGANDGTQNATDDEGAGVEPPNEDAPDSITLYNMLEDRGCSVVRGNVSEGVVLDCETGPLLDLAGNSRMVLVEQEMECEKTYDASSGSVCYRLRDTVTVSLVTGSGSYVWSREYVHVIEEWSEAVFQRYKIPVAEVQFSEAEWSGYARIEIVDSSSDKLSDPVTGPYWAVTLRIRNTGSNVAILNQVCVNDVGASAYGASKPVNGGVASESAQGLALAPGGSKSVRVFIDGDFGRLASGATVNVCLRCEGGADYIELVRLS